jgi:hypothetical protein
VKLPGDGRTGGLGVLLSLCLMVSFAVSMDKDMPFCNCSLEIEPVTTGFIVGDSLLLLVLSS